MSLHLYEGILFKYNIAALGCRVKYFSFMFPSANIEIQCFYNMVLPPIKHSDSKHNFFGPGT